MNRMLQHRREDSKAVGQKRGSSITKLGPVPPAENDENGVLTPSVVSEEDHLKTAGEPLQSSILMIGTRQNDDSKEGDAANRYFSFQQTLLSS